MALVVSREKRDAPAVRFAEDDLPAGFAPGGGDLEPFRYLHSGHVVKAGAPDYRELGPRLTHPAILERT
jgi:hypothetical protein